MKNGGQSMISKPKPKAKKQKSVAKLRDEAAVLLQKLVRMKAADADGIAQCVTCGKKQHYKEMDGGHFISRRWTATKLVEENIHVQCKGCNQYASGRYDDYSLYMVDTYGIEMVRELNEKKRALCKQNRIELEEMKLELRNRIREQEKRLEGA
jgi:5-methylcytosine-specific restriction endonuclease McrA